MKNNTTGETETKKKRNRKIWRDQGKQRTAKRKEREEVREKEKDEGARSQQVTVRNRTLTPKPQTE